MSQNKQAQSTPPTNIAVPSPEVSLDREQAIQTLAYEIWHQEGQPEGRHEAHWAQAEREHDQGAGVS
jgi:hypothetical protein